LRHALGFLALLALETIDWSTWKPHDVATLLFVVRGGEILMIRKKRGLGAGKINGPGGRVEPGESLLECALRETREEIGVCPVGARHLGQLRFQFVDGYGLVAHVFRADDFTGDLVETDEAIPLWFRTDALPFDEMWADDRLWLPLLLEERSFSARFVFDGERMLGCHFEELEGFSASGGHNS
jgi:8-oxo-dGTP diphosphatase